MTHVVVIEKNRDGKIELTKDELQKMLNDAYNNGYSDGSSKWDKITYPSYPYWYTTTNTNEITTDKITIGMDGNKAKVNE